MWRLRSAPAYLRIAAALRDRIQARELPPHALVPSERELSRDFGVSRMTARQALVVLEGEGAVYRRPPRGTFVAEPRLPLQLGSFSDEMVRAGRRPSAEVLWAESQPATPLVADALGLAPGATVYALQRLRGVDGDPLAIETSYYPADLTPDFLNNSLNGSLWDLLAEQYDIHPARATATIEVITLDESATQHLAVRSAAPGILLVRRTYDTNGRCIEFARDTYRADRAAFELEAEIPPRQRPVADKRRVEVRQTGPYEGQREQKRRHSLRLLTLESAAEFSSWSTEGRWDSQTLRNFGTPLVEASISTSHSGFDCIGSSMYAVCCQESLAG